VVDAADYTVWRNHLGTSLSLGAGAASLAVEADSTAELEREVDKTMPIQFVSADNLSTVSSTTPIAHVHRTAIASRAAFDNLLLSIGRTDSYRSSQRALDLAIDDFTSTASADDEFLGVLAADVAGLPALLP
jgi:hypothetical protein